jgi:hypothetical protein
LCEDLKLLGGCGGCIGKFARPVFAPALKETHAQDGAVALLDAGKSTCSHRSPITGPHNEHVIVRGQLAQTLGQTLNQLGHWVFLSASLETHDGSAQGVLGKIAALTIVA